MHNIVLDIYKYGYEHLGDTLLVSEVQDHLTSIGYDLKKYASIMHHTFSIAFETIGSSDGKPRVMFKPDSVFMYLDYIEMKEARADSKEAKRYAIAAIIISGLLAFVQIIVGILPFIFKSK